MSYTKISEYIRSGDGVFYNIRPGLVDKVLDTTGNGTDTFTLTTNTDRMIVFVDGVLQSDYTEPYGTTTLVLGFIPGGSQKVEGYSYTSEFEIVNTISPVTLSVSGYPDEVSVTPTLTGSEFGYGGNPQTHYSSEWEVYQGATLVWSSVDDTVNLSSITVPGGVLDPLVEYTFRVRYTSNLGVYSEWGSVVASTVSGFVGWVATLGGSGIDIFQGVSNDSSGNVYAVGYETSSVGNNEAIITKWSTDGSLLWQKRSGAGGHEVFYGVSTDSNGNVYAVGYLTTTVREVLITKWSADGSLLWQKRFGGSGDDEFLGVSADSSGNVYAVGYETSSVGNQEALITKWSPTGSLLWQKRLGSSSSDLFQGVFADSSDNIYAVGYEASSSGSYDALITKWSTDGSLLWQKRIGGGSSDLFQGVFADSSDNIYAVGYEASSIGNFEALITKWSTDGSLLWQKRIGGGSSDLFYGVSTDSGGNVYAVGYETSSTGGNNEAIITKWASDGSLLWQKRIGGSNGDIFRGVSTDSNGNIYAAGYEASSGSNAIIVKLNPDGSIPDGALSNHPLLSVNTATLAVNTATLAVNTTTLTVNTTAFSVNTTTLAVNTTTFTPVKSEY